MNLQIKNWNSETVEDITNAIGRCCPRKMATDNLNVLSNLRKGIKLMNEIKEAIQIENQADREENYHGE
ncbi:MAG: hypothetical protein GY853_14015 [PVC group bacterium]|nr:hypothetical protein [PVC group bacterium]